MSTVTSGNVATVSAISVPVWLKAATKSRGKLSKSQNRAEGVWSHVVFGKHDVQPSATPSTESCFVLPPTPAEIQALQTFAR